MTNNTLATLTTLAKVATTGRIFGAVVETRSESIRKFNAKTHDLSFHPVYLSNGLINVWENNSQGYRNIALEGVKEIHADGTVFRF